MVRDSEPQDVHPEGLTQEQERLADLMYAVKTRAKVGRRRRLSDGKYEVYKEERKTSPLDFAQNEEEFALLKHEKSPELPLSPFYINLRNLPENVLDQVGRVLAEIQTPYADFAVGIPDAGTPLAEAYSKKSGVPAINIFQKQGRDIEPRENAHKYLGRRIIVIDDVITSGGAKRSVIESLESLRINPVLILVVVDREEGGLEELRKQGISIDAAMRITQLFNYGLRKSYINKEQHKQAMDYLQNA